MILQDLIEGSGLCVVAGSKSVSVTGLSDDSRTVCPGDAFVARGGTHGHGLDHTAEAIARGAVAVISDRPDQAGGADDHTVAWASGSPLTPLRVGQIAERFHGNPSRTLRLVGITGTNGKTTTAVLIQHLLARAGQRCGLIGTVFVDDGVRRQPAALTTPGPIAFSEHLARMVANGCRWAVAEVSSHALDQGRVAAIEFDAAVFTNLSGDHLDYHRSMDDYAAAKARLFQQLPANGYAVVNALDPFADRMVDRCRATVVRCAVSSAGRGAPPSHECGATVSRLTPRSSAARYQGPWGSVEATLPLVGKHNVSNMLQAIAAVDRWVDLKTVLRPAIEEAPVVPGRLEPVAVHGGAGTSPTVLVDYAHTHDALENTLEALRAVAKQDLWVVFGCGGDRDRSKRPKMAAVACRLADRVILTSDNPRGEDPQQIIREIIAGVPLDARDRVTVEADRTRAIDLAVAGAGARDTVLLAGKGHEGYQEIGTQRIPFSDHHQAAAALRRRRNRSATTNTARTPS